MKKKENAIDLRRFFRQAAGAKWLYAASLLLFGALTALYLVRAMPQYVVKGAMLVEDSSDESSAIKSGSLAMMMKTFSVGGFGASSVDNEAHLASSHDVMLRTVRTLSLNRLYIGSRGLHRELLFPSSPVRLEAPAGFFDTLTTSFKVRVNLLAGGKADIKVEKGIFASTVSEKKAAVLPAVIDTPFGSLTLTATDSAARFDHITVNICGDAIAAKVLDEAVTIGIDDKMADIVDFSMKYPSRQLGTAIVNTIMEQYLTKRTERRRQTATEAIDYYNERIAAVAGELAEAERRTSDYRQAHNIAAPETEAEIMSKLKLEGSMEAVKTRSEIDYYTKVLETVNGRLGKNTLIPSVESFRDTSVAVYNGLIARRVNLEKSARPGNPALEKLNEQIAMLSASISANAAKVIEKARADLAVQHRIVGTAGSRLSQYPEMEREYTEILRDREFKNQLYLFLLQNRENAVLKLYANSNPAYIFEPAYTLPKPSPLKPILAIAGALIAAMLFPSAWVVLKMWRSDRVLAPMDVAYLGLEPRSMAIDADPGCINRLRALLTADPSRRAIYLAAPSASAARLKARLAESFADAGLALHEAPAVSSNSALIPLSASELTPAGYTIFTVPTPSALPEIAAQLDSPDATLLILVKAGQTKRKQMRDILTGRRADSVVVAINTGAD